MRALVSAIASLVLPGYGAAITGHRRVALGLAGAVVALHLAALWTPWAFYAAALVRVASAIYGGAAVRRGAALGWFEATALGVAAFAIASMIALRVLAIDGYALPSSSMVPTLGVGDHMFVDKLSLWWRPIERGEVIVFQFPCDHDRDYVKRVAAIGGDTVEVRCDVVYVNGVALPQQLMEARTAYADRDDLRGEWRDVPVARYFEEQNGHRYNIFHDVKAPDREALGVPGVRDFPRAIGDAPSCAATPEGMGRAGADRVIGRIVAGKTGAGACEPQRSFLVPPGYVFALGDNRENSSDSRVWGPVANRLIKGRVTGIWLTTGKGGTSFARVGQIE